MVEYLKTKKGYFYKLKNGEKKRISQEEYNKKNKTRKNKKMIGGAGGEPIEQSDIMYQDDLVCILRPNVKKGIIVWTHFTQPAEMGSLCELGLKTGKQLQREGIDFGRSKIHPYIFFRAPYYSRDIDYTSVETEINSSYGEGQIGRESRVFIRVDPDKTFVFSSEIRDVFKHIVWYGKENYVINNSKKTLSEYLEIINNNREIIENVKPGEKIWYNLFTSKAELFPINADPKEPFDAEQIQINSEILVSIPHLTPDYFVLCTVMDLLTIELPYDSNNPSSIQTNRPTSRITSTPTTTTITSRPTTIETFIVEVLYNSSNEKIYKCPTCGVITGTSAPKDPKNTSLFGHYFNCPNKGKIPKEA